MSAVQIRLLAFFLCNPKVTTSLIDAHNFLNRAWKSVLERSKVPYRKQYNTRNTFIYHCLNAGMSPVAVAQITGYDVKVLFDYYAALINKPELPEII